MQIVPQNRLLCNHLRNLIGPRVVLGRRNPRSIGEGVPNNIVSTLMNALDLRGSNLEREGRGQNGKGSEPSKTCTNGKRSKVCGSIKLP